MPGHGFSYRKYLNSNYYADSSCQEDPSDYCCEWECWPAVGQCDGVYRVYHASTCDNGYGCYNIITGQWTPYCPENTPGFCGCSGDPCTCGGAGCGDCTRRVCWDFGCIICSCEEYEGPGECVEPYPGVIRICWDEVIDSGCWVSCTIPPNECCANEFPGQPPGSPVPPGATAPPGSVRSVGMPSNPPDNGYFSCPIEKALEFPFACSMGIAGLEFPSSCVSEESQEYPPGFDYYLLPDGEAGLTVDTSYLCIEYGVQENDSSRLQVLTGRNRYRYKGIWSAHYMKGFDGCTGPFYPNGYDDMPLLKFGLTSMGDIEKTFGGGTFPIADSRMDLPFFGAKTRRNPQQEYGSGNNTPDGCPPCQITNPPSGYTFGCYDDRICFNCREHDVTGSNDEGIGHYGPYPGQAPWNYGTTAGYMSFDCFNANSSISVVHRYRSIGESEFNYTDTLGYLDIPPVSLFSYLKGMEDWLGKFVRHKTKAYFQSINSYCDNTWGWGYDPEDYQQLTVTFGDNWWRNLDPSLTNSAGTNNVAHVLDLLKQRVENIHLYVTGSSSATVPWSQNTTEFDPTCGQSPNNSEYYFLYGRTAQGRLDSLGATAFYSALFRSDGLTDNYYPTDEYKNRISYEGIHDNGLSRFKLLTPNVFLWDRNAFLSASTADKWKYVYFPGTLNTLFDSGCTDRGMVSDGGDPPVITGSLKKIIRVDETGHRNAIGPGTPNTCRAVRWQACNRTLEDMDSAAVVRISPLRCNGAFVDSDPSQPPDPDEFCLWCSGELGQPENPGTGYTRPCLSYNEIPMISYSNAYSDKSCQSPLLDAAGCTYMPEVSFIAAGLYHSALITEENKILHCWGSNTSGQSTVPSMIQYYEFDDVSCGAEHTVALTSNRRSIYCWGNNSFGQCGGNAASENTSTSIKRGRNPDCLQVAYGEEIRIGASECDSDFPPPDEEIRKVVAGPYYTLALLENGTLTGWGDNRYGQLNIPNKKFSGINAFGNTVVAIEQGGYTAVAWGATSSNQLLSYPLGVSGFSSTYSIDTLVAGGDTAGNGHVLVSDGETVLAYGLNNYGQANPPAILERYGYPIEYLSAGKHHSAALTKSQSATSRIPYCWGRNDEGQCNIPNALDMNVDTNINGKIKMIVCGGYHTLALTEIIPGSTASGIVIGWGSNIYGQASTPSCTIPDV